MSEVIPAPESLRDTLIANVEASEAGTLPTAEERARDEAGRFAAKPKEEAAKVEEPIIEQPKLTTWKKDFLPLHEKLAQGLPLNADEAKKLAAYNIQRENEYKTGVSTYKGEAQNSREIQEAMMPFIPELQSRGIPPAAWIKDVGQAHYILAKGSPEQKVQLFRTLAQQYNVPLQTVQQGGQVPQLVDQLLQKITDLESKVGKVDVWRNQLDSQGIQSAIEQMEGDSATYPHFEAVREDMAQLLERGAATDLPTAYRISVGMKPDLIEAEITRRLEEKQASQTGKVRQAKAQVVSPKTATPSGQVTTTQAKDRRSQIAAAAEAIEATMGGRV